MKTLLPVLLIVALSCSIIEDSDITSQEELDNLALASIEIRQETVGGNNSTTAVVTTNAIVNIPVSVPPFSGTITRQVWMNWPALSANKLKLKSGVATSFKSYTSYLDSGQPWTFYLFQVNGSDTTIIELYRFRYDANGRLNQIITNAPFIEGGPATSRDTLIYNSTNNESEVTSIIRRSSDPAKAGTFTISAGSFFNLQSFYFQGTAYNKSCQGNGCGQYWGGEYYSSPNSGDGFPYGVMNLVVLPGQYYIQDINKDVTNFCNNQCSQGNDTYYLHPLMILKDQFNSGDVLLFLYMVDWWQPLSQVESTSDEKVTFTFKYDL